jgi:RNA polymerase sigma factor (sigma-70 family)
MKGAFGGMKNILYEGYLGPRLPREVQLKRVQKVITEELTDLQRLTLVAYYFQELTIPEIARQRGVHKSTVSRTLHRAEDKLRKYLKY